MSRNVTGTDVRKSLTRNVSILLGAQLITWVSSFVLLYFLPRYLGSEDFGRLYLALSINMMLGLLIDFGGSYLIPKEVARSKKGGGRILNSYILMRIGLWLLSIGLVMLLAGFIGYSEHIYLLIVTLAVGKLWEGGGKALKSFFYGIERMEYPALATFLMMIPVYYMISIQLYWMIGLVLSGILYLVLLYAVGTFNRQEVGLMKEFLSWKQLKMTFSGNKS